MKQLFIFLIFITAFTSCQKFLDKKSNKSLAIPSTTRDAQAILDNYTIMNTFYSPAGAQSDDDYYLDDAFFNSISTENQNNYTWNKEVYNPTSWNLLYQIVFNANVALEAITGIHPSPYNGSEYNNTKGQALFFRGYGLFQAAQLWAPAYNKSTASVDLGIPLRLSTDPNLKTTRATVEQTYAQIIADLQAAAALLPSSVPVKSRPSRAAAYAALARTFLSMQQYSLAGTYADSCLQSYNTLIDYNTVTQSSSTPFPLFNPEVIFQSQFLGASMLANNNWKVDSLLYKSYVANDLRKSLFFVSNGAGTYGFKGSYNGITSGANFNGFATDEIYLIRAEAYARGGNKDAALADLDTVLTKRWKAGTFIPYTATDADDALNKILAERRKELIGRGLRWSDLRRLNMEPRFAKTLSRKVNGSVYELSPNDKRYTFYIPQNVIDFSGITQNER